VLVLQKGWKLIQNFGRERKFFLRESYGYREENDFLKKEIFGFSQLVTKLILKLFSSHYQRFSYRKKIGL